MVKRLGFWFLGIQELPVKSLTLHQLFMQQQPIPQPTLLVAFTKQCLQGLNRIAWAMLLLLRHEKMF